MVKWICSKFSTAGSDKLISHIHDGQDGGTQDYFERPTDGTLKAAVIFNSSDKTIHIIEVDESFDATLSDDVVDQWYRVRFFCGLAIIDRFLLTNKNFLFFIYVSLAIFFFFPVIIFVLGFLSTLNRLCYFPRTIHYCKKKKN